MKINQMTPAQKANVTKLIREYIAAKTAEQAAKAAKAAAATELIKAMNGDANQVWATDDGSIYQLAVVYGKTSKSLNKDLIENVLGVKVTDGCYKVSTPWDELRVTIKA